MEKKAKFDAENASSAKDAEANGYPQLEGTEKQIGWANTIRLKQITEIKDRYLYTKQQDELTEQEQYAWGIITDEIDNILTQHTKVKWWIDNRYDNVFDAELKRYY